MNKTRYLVLAFVILGGTFAAAQTFGFGVSFGSTGLYCNYEQLHYYNGGLWAGADNLSFCPNGLAFVSDIAGFASTVPPGALAHGKGVVYGDSIYAMYNGLADAQWTVFTKLKCNRAKNRKFMGGNGWEGVATFSLFIAGTNEGPLSCILPGQGKVIAGVTSNGFARPLHGTK